MSDAFIKKNVRLSLEFDAYVATHPQLLDEIPDRAYVLITVHEDQEFNSASMSLIKDKRRKKIVEAHKSGATWSIRPLHPVTVK